MFNGNVKKNQEPTVIMARIWLLYSFLSHLSFFLLYLNDDKHAEL